MNTVDPDLARIGDQLQARWRVDAQRARGRRRTTLCATSLAGALAIAGGAVASGVLPIHLASSSSKTPPAALAKLRAFLPPGSPFTLQLDRARTIGTITSPETGALSVVVVPLSPRGACVDAARNNGSSYVGACATLPHDTTTVSGSRITYYEITSSYEGAKGHPPLSLLFRSAPPGAARVDVRERDGSKRPAVMSHGWMISISQRPDGPAALVRFYDRAGKRILSFYG
jgi:hypothetical protein